MNVQQWGCGTIRVALGFELDFGCLTRQHARLVHVNCPDARFVNYFSHNFRALLERSGKSQKELAAALGCSESAIVNYKRGRIPKDAELQRICEFFDVPPKLILYEKMEAWLGLRDEFHKADQFAARVAESKDDDRIKNALASLKLERDANRRLAKQLGTIAEQIREIAAQLDLSKAPVKYSTKKPKP